MKKMVLWAVIALVLGLGAYIRLAPSAPAQWHIAPVAEVDQDLPGGVLRVVATGPEGLQKLDRIARATPRTSVLAGSVDEGMITYVTRTKWIGFPDYTTVRQDSDTLRIHGRLRFGRRDFGVNKARVDGWLEQM
ncbi:DUF1499 domain-containing protein [Ruegeria marisrubri]|uniref:DUF1499 domain-containing protein n=1 Tax=Ruegeria marisrubri TaxID=1685379 RepID=UPI001CD30860|nr:DUF1499 domain-containing protein [Ruegeria marisrubri]MCA0904853.1 DUF1499 domain-containing protein [Ruegeria marisrubri]